MMKKLKRILTASLCLLLLATFLISCDEIKISTGGGDDDDDVKLCEDGAHDWSSDYTVVEEGSCTEPEIRKHVCKICGYLEEYEASSLGHKLEDTAILRAATCEKEGILTGICKVCGEAGTKSIPKKDHVLAGATRLVAGQYVRSCKNCKKAIPVEGPSMSDRYDENGRVNDELYNYGLDYDGEKVTVMHWQAENSEFEIESVTGHNVDDAIYDRNDRIEDRLNVDLEWTETLGHAGMTENFVRQVEAYYNAGVTGIDIIATYSQTMGVLAIQGYMMDLAAVAAAATEEYPYLIDLEKPWWPQQLVETVSFGSSYYFLSGDISTNVLHMAHVLYFNKNMCDRYDIEYPYQDVYDGTWTLDKLIAMTSGVYVDKDAKPGKSNGDVFGLIGRSYVLDAFYIGSNMHYLETDAQNELRVSDDLSSSRTVLLVRKLGDMFQGDDWATKKFGEMPGEDYEDIDVFRNGNALVLQQHLQAAEKNLVGKVAFKFGVLPMPKYDERQVNYYTNVGNPMTLYGLFVGLNERDDMDATLSMLTAVLECWASEGYRLTTPEIFEVNMQLKYADGKEDADMFEYIRSGITFDMGRFFNIELGQVSTRVGYCMATGASWSSYWEVYEPSLQKNLETIIENFKYYNESRKY